MNIVPIYFCSYPSSARRKQLAEICLHRLGDLGVSSSLNVYSAHNFVVRHLSPVGLEPGREFQRRRRQIAQENARQVNASCYVLMDDDVLLLNLADLNVGLEALLRHAPQFALLAGWPLNEKIIPWTPHVFEADDARDPKVPANDNEVLEHYSCGGLRFCNTAAIMALDEVGWPPLLPNSYAYDGQQCRALHALGFRVGYARRAAYIHLGKDLSEVWRSRDGELE